MVVSIRFESETEEYVSGVNDAIKALKDWESQTGVSALNATEKFEEAIEAVIYLGRVTGRTRDDMKDALRGIGLSAEDAEDALRAVGEESRDVGRESPREMGRAEEAVRDLGDTADDAGTKVEGIKDKTGTVGEGLRSLGDIARDVLQGDFEGAASGAVDALSSIGGALTGGLVGGAIASGVAGIVSSWIKSWQDAAEQTKKIVSDAFREMAEDGIASWESVQSQMRRLSEAYDEHEGEIKRIAELTGLNFETVASAWAGNKDAIEAVNRAYGDQVDELGKVPGATKDAVDATVRGWEGIMAPLNNTLDAYDTAKQKAKAYSNQVSEGLLSQLEGVGKVAVEIDEVGNRLITLPDKTQVLIDADTGQATLNVDKFRGDVDGVIDHINKREARLQVRLLTAQAKRQARLLAGEISRETATITINTKFGRRFGG